MRLATYICILVVVASLVGTDGRKTFSTRRKSGGNNSRRGGNNNFKHKEPPPPVNNQKVNAFLNSERASSTHGSSSPGATNTHYRGNPFDKQPEAGKHTPQTNGPIGFEKVANQGNQKLGFDKVNSEVQNKPVGSHVPSAPAYPGASPVKPGSVQNGPPPAYPGYGASGTGSHSGGFEPPPAYPGRPVNAPPVYTANNPSYPKNSGFQQSNTQQQSAYPGQGSYHGQGSYPGQGSYQGQGSYPAQGSYPGQGSYHNQGSYPGQQNPNHGGSFGSYPNQGYNQGFGSNPSGGFGSWGSGGYGSSYPGQGGYSHGGSQFGQPNPYGGSPFGSGSGGFGGSGYNNPHYGPNNFGFSNNPGLFGSNSYNNYGYKKKSRFGLGGLPIPIPIPIPIPFGGFGGWGGRSHNHNVLDTFVKNQTVSPTANSTTNVYLLNNSTVTPCTTDQFIYDSLNVTVLSCTTGNCTAIKVFTTTNISGDLSGRSAGITMCLDSNTTYSSFADNVNPIVSDLQKYWMRVCKEGGTPRYSGNTTEEAPANVTVKISEFFINETSTGNTTENPSNVSSLPNGGMETTLSVTESNATSSTTPSNSTLVNNSSSCEIFNCSYIEMCLPSIEIIDRCSTPECPFTRTGYQPCVRVKMCKSPTTPVSTFATLNTTISRIDQFNNVSSVSDLVNLTLISYMPPTVPVNCSENTTDQSCPPPPPISLPDVCGHDNTTMCAPVLTPLMNSSMPQPIPSSDSPKRDLQSEGEVKLDDVLLEELRMNLTIANQQMAELQKTPEDDTQQSEAAIA